MAKKITTIKCPQCGSTKQKKIDDEHFECLNCGSEYVLDTDDITINHNYTYNNAGMPTTPINKKGLAIVFFIVLSFFVILFLIPSIFTKNSSSAKTGILATKKTWTNETVSQAFADKDNVLKLFIVGKIGLDNDRSNSVKNEKLYWSVYNISSGKTEQLNLFNDLSENITLSDIILKPFNDGSIYFVLKKTKVYQYDILKNSLVFMNPDLEKKIDKLKTGIGSIEINPNYNCLDIVSNTGAKISYFPLTKLQFQQSESVNAMPNAVLETNYAVSNSNPNYLVKYQAMQQKGYPVFNNPTFNINFNEKEEPLNATISNNDINKAYIKDYNIVSTKNRMHKLIILGNNKENVAIAYKENIQEGENYKIQLLNNSGNVLWDLKTNTKFIASTNNSLSATNELLVTTNNVFLLVDKTGKITKKFNLDEIALDPKD